MPIHINHINNTISTGENADVTGNNSIIFNNTGSIVLSRGTTGQRPVVPENGMIRYNTSTNFVEIYSNSSWKKIFAGNVEDLTGPNNEFIIDGITQGPGTTNYFKISNANPSDAPKISVDGSDTNISINLVPKNDGSVIIGEGNKDGYISSDENKDLILIGGKNIQLIPTSTGSFLGEVKIYAASSAELVVFDNKKVRQYNVGNVNSYKDSYVVRLTTNNSSTAKYSVKLPNNSTVLAHAYVVGLGDLNTNRLGMKLDALCYVVTSTASLLDNVSQTLVATSGGPMDATFVVSGDSIELRVLGASATTNWTGFIDIVTVI